jgi:hypothetical protein
MWAWVVGGVGSTIGGLCLVSRSRWLALLCIFGGFVLLLSAFLFLPDARKAYEEQRGRSWHGDISIR